MFLSTMSTECSKHKFSRGSWVSFLDCSVLCVYLSGEAPPTSCYHGDTPSWVSCLYGCEEMFSVFNSVGVQWDCFERRLGAQQTLQVYCYVVLGDIAIPYTRVNKRIRLFQKLQGNMRLIPNMRLIMRDKN